MMMRGERRAGQRQTLYCSLLCALLLLLLPLSLSPRRSLDSRGGLLDEQTFPALATCRINDSVADWLAASSIKVVSCATYEAHRRTYTHETSTGDSRTRYIIDRGTCNGSSAAALRPSAGLCVSAGGVVSCLPTFVIPGAMKSGTGELMKWLNRHPLLRSGTGDGTDGGKREVHFFHEQAAHGSWLDYASHFPLGGSAAYTFDKSPDYVRSPAKMAQLQHMLPDVKLVVLLRDPTERLFSAFRHNCRHGRYARVRRAVAVRAVPAYARALGVGSSRTIRRGAVVNTETIGALVPSNESAGAYTAMRRCGLAEASEYYLGSSRPSNTSHLQAQAAEEFRFGAYHEQLAGALRLLPRVQVLVIFQEHMLRDTLGALRQVENFVRVPCFDFASVAAPQQRLPGASERAAGREAPPPQLRDRLRELYRPLNAQLERLLREHYGEEGKLPAEWS